MTWTSLRWLFYNYRKLSQPQNHRLLDAGAVHRNTDDNTTAGVMVQSLVSERGTVYPVFGEEKKRSWEAHRTFTLTTYPQSRALCLKLVTGSKRGHSWHFATSYPDPEMTWWLKMADGREKNSVWALDWHCDLGSRQLMHPQDRVLGVYWRSQAFRATWGLRHM